MYHDVLFILILLFANLRTDSYSLLVKSQNGNQLQVRLRQNILMYQTQYLIALTLTTLWTNSADDKLVIIFLFFPENTGFDILCKLSPLETICIKCQIL